MEMEDPQGSILSITLIILQLNNIVQWLPPNFVWSLYVNDFFICYRSRNVNAIEHLLQRCLSRTETWADDFKFSKTKIVCWRWCQYCTLHSDPELKLKYGTNVPVINEVKFLVWSLIKS